MHVGSLAPSTSHPPFLFAGEALHPPLLCALTFAPHLFFAGLALHPPSALRPQLCTPPLFCGLSFAGIKGFPKLKSLNAYFLVKIGADTAENEQHFAEILPIDASTAATGSAQSSNLLSCTGTSTGGSRERRLAKFRQNVARFRLYRLRFLQVNMRSTAFFKIYQILKLKFLKFDKILQILRHLQNFC